MILDDSPQMTLDGCSFCDTAGVQLPFIVSDEKYAHGLCSWLCVMAFAAGKVKEETDELRRKLADSEVYNAHLASGALS